jgi:hypothetical protein
VSRARPRRRCGDLAAAETGRRHPARQADDLGVPIGGTAFDTPFPPARNPWNTERDPAGSSSGSGAAVAAGLCAMAMGSDTGGSIRWPAA